MLWDLADEADDTKAAMGGSGKMYFGFGVV
jgi:hypothetical protein